MTEATANHGITAAASAITAIVVGVLTSLHIGSVPDATTFIGLLTTGLTSLVSAYFLGRNIASRLTAPTQGTLPL